MMKSENDLWKGRTGWSMLFWRASSECADSRRGSISLTSNPRIAAIVDGERGFIAKITAPRTGRTPGSFSVSSSSNASWRIDV